MTVFAALAAAALLWPTGTTAQTTVGCMAPGNTQIQRWTQPAGTKPICTFNFTFTYSCQAASGGGFGQNDSTVTTVNFNNDPNVTIGWQMRPWEPQPILIKGARWAVLTGTTPDWFAIGNAARPDLLPGPWSSVRMGEFYFPDGYGWPWPSKSQYAPTEYFDVHGQCPVGGGGTIQVVFMYEPLGPLPPPPPFAWNPNDKAPTIVLSNGNLSAAGSASVIGSVRAIEGKSSGKWRWQNVVTGRSQATSLAGFASEAASIMTYIGNSPVGVGVQATNGQTSFNGLSCTQPFVPFSTIGDVMDFAIDHDAGKIWLGKNGAWLGSGDPATGTNPWCTFTPGLKMYPAWAAGDAANTGTARFKASSFTGPATPGFAPYDPD